MVVRLSVVLCSIMLFVVLTDAQTVIRSESLIDTDQIVTFQLRNTSAVAPQGVTVFHSTAENDWEEPYSFKVNAPSLSGGIATATSGTIHIGSVKCIGLHADETVTLSVALRNASSEVQTADVKVIARTVSNTLRYTFIILAVVGVTVVLVCFVFVSRAQALQGLQQMQLIVLLSYAPCARTPLSWLSGELWWLLHPVEARVSSANHPLETGVMLLHSGVIVGAFIANLLIVPGFKTSDASWRDAVVRSGFPSIPLTVFVVLQLGTAWAYFSTFMRNFGSDAFLGVLGVIFYFVGVPAAVGSRLQGMSFELFCDALRRARYGAVSSDLRYHKRWFHVVEMVLFSIWALACSTKPTSPSNCVVQQIVVALICAVLAVLTLIHQPYLSSVPLYLNVAVYVCLLGTAVLALLSSSCLGGSDLLPDLSLALAGLSLAVVIIKIIFICAISLRHKIEPQELDPNARSVAHLDNTYNPGDTQKVAQRGAATDRENAEGQELKSPSSFNATVRFEDSAKASNSLDAAPPRESTASMLLHRESILMKALKPSLKSPPQPIAAPTSSNSIPSWTTEPYPGVAPEKQNVTIDIQVGARLVTEEDALKVLKQYGTVRRILLLGDGQGTVVRAEFSDPEAAQRVGAARPHIGDVHEVDLRRVPCQSFRRPCGMHRDGVFLFVADSERNCVVQLDPSTGAERLLAGSSRGVSGNADGVMGDAGALLNQPWDVCLVTNRLYVTDRGNSALRCLDLSTGTVTTVVSSIVLLQPTGVCFHQQWNQLVVADTGHHRILAFDMTTWSHKVVVGTGQPGFGDGANPVTTCDVHRLSAPEGVCYHPARRTLFVADTANHVMLEVGVNRKIKHRLGAAGRPFTTSAREFGGHQLLNAPTSLYFGESDGNSVWLVDTGSQRVIRYDPDSKRVRVALESAQMVPAFVCDAHGGYYVSDSKHRAVFRITPDSDGEGLQHNAMIAPSAPNYGGHHDDLCSECDSELDDMCSSCLAEEEGPMALCPQCLDVHLCDDCISEAPDHSTARQSKRVTSIKKIRSGAGLDATQQLNAMCQCGWYCTKCERPVRVPRGPEPEVVISIEDVEATGASLIVKASTKPKLVDVSTETPAEMFVAPRADQTVGSGSSTKKASRWAPSLMLQHARLMRTRNQAENEADDHPAATAVSTHGADDENDEVDGMGVIEIGHTDGCTCTYI